MTKKCSSQISQRVADVRCRMEEAALRVGRRPDEITLIGVTKTQPVEAIRELILAGVPEIGENKVQELLDKEPYLEDIPHKMHLIGHLQRNKAKYLPGHINMLQSLDNLATVGALEKAFTAENELLDVLIEVNIGDESSKNGVSLMDLPGLLEGVNNSEKLRLRGLMCIPPFGLGEGIRLYFKQMYQLFIDIKAKKMDNDNVNILSMGMSSDFEIAIEEGATMVRVGTDLFGPRNYG